MLPKIAYFRQPTGLFSFFFLFLLFWGCPSLWSGRAVSGLAGLLGPARALPAGSGLTATLVHPSAGAAAPPPKPQREDGAKIESSKRLVLN
ncbi:hypothetical protein SGRA_2598 [Saprospira grandis str. Lewin]|uniref:Uncharacterized protein n=1 Tax=Saprospira grandis (strain Lewin) TaxID=984262 RepID=H6L6T0_SAPGL|nr:hypothetical protein SGRA_2598 [Saprospira grandis str. Lewin]